MTHPRLKFLSGFLFAFQAFTQSPVLPSFEVADVKPSKEAMPGKGRILPGGRIEIPGASLKDLIRLAYGVQENMIHGAPNWAGHDRFDIVAKGVGIKQMPTLRLMVQSLLAERFKLSMHREEKMLPAYALIVGKNGPKLQAPTGERQQCNWSSVALGLRRRECHNMTLDDLATQLPGWAMIGIDRPVVDETGLKGSYDFHFDVGLGDLVEKRRSEGEGAASIAPPDPGPTIFAAMEQLGLKLESRKMPLSVIVVDHAELPSEN